MNYIIIGNRIRKARKEKEMTQEEFAEKMGISVGYVNQIETGNATKIDKMISEINGYENRFNVLADKIL